MAMKRITIVINDDTHQRLKMIKKNHGITIGDSIEFLASEHLNNLENRLESANVAKMLLRGRIDSVVDELYEIVDKM